MFIASGSVTLQDVWDAVDIERPSPPRDTVTSRVACDVRPTLDAIAFEYGSTPKHRTPILVGSWPTLPVPPHAANNRSRLAFDPSKNVHKYCANIERLDGYISYVQGTAFYTWPLFCLELIRQFDVVFKGDVDLRMFRPMRFDIVREFDRSGAVWAHSARYLFGDRSCADGINAAVEAFLAARRRRGGDTRAACSAGLPEFEWEADLYYTNFVGLRPAFFASRPVMEFARFLYNYEEGYFTHRWTDQIYWHKAMGMFLGPDFQDWVLDFSRLRCRSPELCSIPPMTKQEAAKWCAADSSFLHTYQDPEEIFPHLNNTRSSRVMPRDVANVSYVAYMREALKLPAEAPNPRSPEC